MNPYTLLNLFFFYFSKYIEEKTIESEIKLFKRFFDDGKVKVKDENKS